MTRQRPPDPTAVVPPEAVRARRETDMVLANAVAMTAPAEPAYRRAAHTAADFNRHGKSLRGVLAGPVKEAGAPVKAPADPEQKAQTLTSSQPAGGHRPPPALYSHGRTLRWCSARSSETT
jgi:hypothetical protein